MYQIYNTLLRVVSEQEGADVSKFTNRYPTTLACIVSGILKLSRIAKMPEGAGLRRAEVGLVQTNRKLTTPAYLVARFWMVFIGNYIITAGNR